MFGEIIIKQGVQGLQALACYAVTVNDKHKEPKFGVHRSYI